MNEMRKSEPREIDWIAVGMGILIAAIGLALAVGIVIETIAESGCAP